MSRDVPKGEQTVFRHSGGWESVSFDYTSFWKNLTPEAFQNTQISLSGISGPCGHGVMLKARSSMFGGDKRAGHGGAAAPSAVAAARERGVTAGPGCHSGPGAGALGRGGVPVAVPAPAGPCQGYICPAGAAARGAAGAGRAAKWHGQVFCCAGGTKESAGFSGWARGRGEASSSPSALQDVMTGRPRRH